MGIYRVEWSEIIEAVNEKQAIHKCMVMLLSDINQVATECLPLEDLFHRIEGGVEPYRPEDITRHGLDRDPQ